MSSFQSFCRPDPVFSGQKKTCTKCGETKPIELFHNRGNSETTKRGACRDCENSRNSQYARERRQREKPYADAWDAEWKACLEDPSRRFTPPPR